MGCVCMSLLFANDGLVFGANEFRLRIESAQVVLVFSVLESSGCSCSARRVTTDVAKLYQVFRGSSELNAPAYPRPVQLAHFWWLRNRTPALTKGFGTLLVQRVSELLSVSSNSTDGSYLVDPASSHMLVSKIKPCMSKYKHLYCETANGSLNQLSFI